MTSISLPLSIQAIPVIFLALFALSFLKLSGSSILGLRLWAYNKEGGEQQKSVENANSTILSSLQGPNLAVEKESRFSTDWWCHDSTFQLERRAIFSKSWIYTTHRSFFVKPGDYITLNTGGFSFFLILGKDLAIRAFHNVCRHRAYEITRKECGSTTILSCRYHGWSYNTEGKLMKAPEFDDIPDFDKNSNGLWEIHVKVSSQGLVFVNLDTVKVPSDFEERELDIDLKYSKISHSKRVNSWRYDCDFNWKIALAMISTDICNLHLFQDLRNQAYSISEIFRPNLRLEMKEHKRINMFTTIIICPIQKIWLAIKILPQSASKTTIDYEMYTWADQDPANLEAAIDKLKKASFNDTRRVQTLQKQFIEGSVLLDSEQIDQQNAVNALLIAHRKLEISEGGDIHPAARQICLGIKGQDDVNLCKRLEKSLTHEPSDRIGEFPRGESLDW